MKSSQPSAAELAAALESSGASEYVIGSGARGAGGGSVRAGADEALYIKETRARANKSAEQTDGKQKGAEGVVGTTDGGATGGSDGAAGVAGAVTDGTTTATASSAEQPAGRINSLIKAADALSLGLSMVVAVLIGVALGIWLAGFWPPLLWLGVALGIAAAVNNVYKAYRRMLAMDEAANADGQVK